MNSNAAAPADPSVDHLHAQAAAPAPAPLSRPPLMSAGWMGQLALGVGGLALVGAVLMWQRLDRIQQELARRSAEMAEESIKARDMAAHADALTQELQARLSVAEVKLSEVSLQRTQLEELMLSVSRSRDDTLVLDIESGLRLAMQQAELTGSAQPLVSALVAADQRIGKAAQPRLNPVQRAIGRDIDRVKASSVADLPALASQLDELARLSEEWPLLNAPPPARGAVRTGGQTPLSGKNASVPGPDTNLVDGDGEPLPRPQPVEPVKPPATGKTARPAAEPSQTETPAADGVSSAWQGLRAQWGRFWDRSSAEVVRAMRDLVRVSRIDQPDAVLLAPDQAVFLRENIKLKLLNARLSLLSRQVPAARADLLAVRATLLKYFDPQAQGTRQALHMLTEALQVTRSVEMPRPDESLTALAAAAGGR